MSENKRRLVFSYVLWVARAFGWLLVVIAILGTPQMQFLTGRLAVQLELVSSIMLGLAGIAWLVGVKLFLRFFDRYLSSN